MHLPADMNVYSDVYWLICMQLSIVADAGSSEAIHSYGEHGHALTVLRSGMLCCYGDSSISNRKHTLV